VHFKPPKNEGFCDDHPGVELDQRADDTSEKVQVRLQTYEESTKPLLDFYESSGRLQKVDGTKDPEEIYKAIEGLIASNNATV